MSELDFRGPIEGTPFLALGAFELRAIGYVREEWIISGVATSYVEDGERTPDGQWDARRDRQADFKTRLVVIRPSDPAHFSGTVVIEWLNVSGGLDAAPDWLFLHRHLMREGVAWVGLSAQKAGIDGGGLVPGLPLKEADEERYRELVHPGDAWSFDILTQLGRALRRPGAGPLGKLAAARAIALGESQSAGFLVTYANAIDPLEQCFDGFLIHGRGGGAAAIDGSYLRRPADGDVSRIGSRLLRGERIREDVRVPVLTLQSETDVIGLGSINARQPDGERFRLWEIAGASHFDSYGLVAAHHDDGTLSTERYAALLAPTDTPMGLQADSPVNAGPQQHYVAQAALARLEGWIRRGAAPPVAERLETADSTDPGLTGDALGISRGGIRTPWVDAPTALLSGLGQTGEGFMFLFGRTEIFDGPTLARLYPGGAEQHLELFLGSLERTVDAGFVLEADAAEIAALGRHGHQPSGFRHD